MKDLLTEETLELALVAGRPCLDFANHGQRLLGGSNPYSYFIEFSLASRLISPEEAERLLLAASQRASQREALIRRVTVLAEALKAGFEALSRGQTPPARSLSLLNREIRNANANLEIVEEDGSFRWAWRESSPLALERPLWPIASDAGDLLTQEDPCHLKLCHSDRCRWLFFDTSKNSSRRWCDMAACGNRAKARRFRERHGAPD